MLLYRKLQRSLPNGVKAPLDAMPAFEAKANDKHILTINPKDVFNIDSLLKHCRKAEKRPKFILQVCDFRMALTERNEEVRHQWSLGYDYGIGFRPTDAVSNTEPGLLPYVLAILEALARDDIDVLLVRYESLVQSPERERLRIEAFTGLTLTDRFLEDDDVADADITSEKPLADVETGAGSGVVLSRRFKNWTATAKAFFHGTTRSEEGVSDAPPWCLPAGAAAVVHAFRRAPKLFKYARGLGYERDDFWTADLKRAASSYQRDPAGTIVAFYTDNTLYEAEARRLEASVLALGLPLEVIAVPDQGSWLANVRFKPAVLSKARERLEGPLLYVDVDAVLHTDPWPDLSGFDQDVAFCTMRDGKVRSGTILLNDTDGARRFLDEWTRRLEADREAWDQTPLTGMLTENRRAEDPPFTIGLLPVPMCYVFDRVPERLAEPVPVPVIEHLQVSRELPSKAMAPGGQERLMRRHVRLKELEENTALRPKLETTEAEVS